MSGQLLNAIPMNNNELLILSLLKDRPIQKPIMNNEIQNKTGLTERRIRRIIQQLILMYRQPIGSSTGRPQGYYWIKSMEEAEHNYRRLRSRALVILKRAATLKGIGTDEMINQLKFDLRETSNETKTKKSAKTQKSKSGTHHTV